jgi:iron complex outermembrane receptor protein
VGARQASGAAFVQASLDLTRYVRASAGGRFEAQNTRSVPVGEAALANGKGIFAPKLGLLFRIPSLGALYGNVSRGYRQTDGVIEDPTLPFITEWVYETGAKLDLRGLAASAAFFRVDVSNEQTFDPIRLTSTSGGASRRQGIELDLTVRPASGVAFAADWTLNDARYRHLVTETDTLDGARVFNTARYVGTVGVTLTPRAGWHVGASVNVVGPYSPFDEPGVLEPAYALVHVSAGARAWAAGELDVGVRNLLDRAYPELRAGGFVSPGQPRTVYVTLRVTP